MKTRMNSNTIVNKTFFILRKTKVTILLNLMKIFTAVDYLNLRQPCLFKKLKNNGSIHVLGVFFLSIISYLLFLSYQNILLVEKKINVRLNHYLCVKRIVFWQKKLVGFIEHNNKLILVGRTLKSYPKTYSAGNALINGAKIAQSTFYIFEAINFLKLKNCDKKQLPLLLATIPYRTPFNRDSSELVIAKKKKWTLFYQNLNLDHYFSTLISSKTKGRGNHYYKVNLKEISAPEGMASLSF